MTIYQFLRTLQARRRLIGATMGLMLVLLFLMILIVPAKYTATASVLVNSESKDPIVGALMQTPLGESFVTTQAAIIESPRVAQRVVEHLKMADDPKWKAAWQEDTDGHGDLTAWIADIVTIGLKVSPGHESNVVEINYKSKDPVSAALFANAFAQAYLETSEELKVDPVKQSSKFFDARIAETRARLSQAQQRLSDAQKAAGIVVTPERLDVENAHLNELSSQLTLAQSQQADATSRDQSSHGNVGASPDVMQNPVVQQLKTQVAIQEAKVRNLGTQLGPNHPAYKQAEQERADLRRSLGSETGQVGNSLQQANQIGSARVAQLQAATETQRQRIMDLSQKRDQLSVLQREVDNDQKAYDLVMQRSSETGIESQVVQSDTSLLTSASEPTHPSFPKIKLFIVLTLILGLLLGIGLALLIEILNPVVHSPLDIIEQLALPVFAVVPYGAIPGRKHSRTTLLGGTRKLLPAS